MKETQQSNPKLTKQQKVYLTIFVLEILNIWAILLVPTYSSLVMHLVFYALFLIAVVFFIVNLVHTINNSDKITTYLSEYSIYIILLFIASIVLHFRG